MSSMTRTIVVSDAEQTATVRSIMAILNDIDPTIIEDNGKICIWFGLQNKDAAASIYNQTDPAAAANANVEITPGQYRQFPPDSAKYDLEAEYVRVGTNNQVFSIDIKWG